MNLINITDIILAFFIPFILVASPFYSLSRFKSFRILPLLIRFTISAAISISFLIIGLSLWGIIMPWGFKIVARILFLLYLTGSCLSVRYIIKKQIFKLNSITSLRFNNVKIFITLFVGLYLLLFILRPVVDADIVNSYLPLARSIYIYDKIPTHNYYDVRPFIIPPAGAPAVFAFYYALAGNINSQSFQLVNTPFFLGFLILAFYNLRYFFNKKLSITGVLLVLSTPLLEDMVFQTGVYPDFIFSFLFNLIIYLSIRGMFIPLNKKDNFFIAVISGIVLAASLLLKYQSVFLYILAFLILFIQTAKGKWRLLSIPVLFVPFLIYKIPDAQAFTHPRALVGLCLFIILLIISVMILRLKTYNTGIKQYLNLTGLVSLIGFSFLFRNLIFFGDLNDRNPDFVWAVNNMTDIGIKAEGGSTLDALSILFAPSLAIYWIIPFLIGLIFLIFRKTLNLLFILPAIWYIYWILFLGSVDYKWLLPVLPFFSGIILSGLKYLYKNSTRIEKIVFCSLPFMVLSSKFIFWNWAVSQFGSVSIRSGTSGISGGRLASSIIKNSHSEILFSNLSRLVSAALNELSKAQFILTSRTPIKLNDIPYLLVMTILFFILIIFLANNYFRLRLKIIFPVAIFIVYGLTYYKISEGNLLKFGIWEKMKLFDYWGLTTHVVPIINKISTADDKIITFSIPSGMAYYTGLKDYNLQYGGGLSVLRPIFYSSDLFKIQQFMQKNGYRFIAILYYQDSAVRFDKLKKKTKIFSILDNPVYARLLLSPQDNNFWYLYDLKYQQND